MKKSQTEGKKDLREKSLEWFLSKTENEKIDLKNKYFSKIPIGFDGQWGFNFTFGQIENMYLMENL